MAAKTEGTGMRYGALLLLVGALQFLVCMAIVQAYYPCTTSCYNMLTNAISDLGNTNTSAIWPLFGYSLAMFGAIGLSGIVLSYRVLVRNRAGLIGIALLVLGVFGAVGVGVVPENTILSLHSLFALVAFLSSGLGILVLGLTAIPDRRMRMYSAYSILFGLISVVTLLASILLPQLGLLPHWITSGPGFGFGGIERIVAFPPLLWFIITGLLLALNPKRYSNKR